MIDNKRIIGLIPARGGSKGVPRKNVRMAGGKPLIGWTVEAGRASRYIDRLIISSDDHEIIDVAVSFGCEAPFRRPDHLATDEADALSVAQHALSVLQDSGESYDYLVLLQPTSPMRTAQDIDGAIELCLARGATTCVGICEPDKSPYWMLTLDGQQAINPLFSASQIPDRRQAAPLTFALNGAVYVAAVSHVMAGKSFFAPGAVGYAMPKERSFDIDSELDLKIVNYLLLENGRPS